MDSNNETAQREFTFKESYIYSFIANYKKHPSDYQNELSNLNPNPDKHIKEAIEHNPPKISSYKF